VVAKSHWASWYETAAALWPVIAGQKGNPLAMLQHCMGTTGIPDDGVLDCICTTVVAEAPLDEAALSLVEIRTLGGATLSGRKLPSGNCHHTFFIDVITLYDANGKTGVERQTIVDLTYRLIDKARKLDGLTVDYSGTHSQPDDVRPQSLGVRHLRDRGDGAYRQGTDAEDGPEQPPSVPPVCQAALITICPKRSAQRPQQLSILRAVRLLQHHGYVGDRVDEGARVGRMARMGSLWSGTAA